MHPLLPPCRPSAPRGVSFWAFCISLGFVAREGRENQVPELSSVTLTMGFPGLAWGVAALRGAVDRSRPWTWAAVSFPRTELRPPESLRGPGWQAGITDEGFSFSLT
jgi:hypothetical protein